jgi:hypothetical protein
MNVFRAANEFLKDCIASNQSISTEEGEHINRLTRSSEKFFTRNNIRENTALHAVVNSRKNRLAGKRGILKGHYCITKTGLYVQLAQHKKAAEEKVEAVKKRKRKGKGKTDPPVDLTIVPSLSLQLDMEVLSESEDEEQ